MKATLLSLTLILSLSMGQIVQAKTLTENELLGLQDSPMVNEIAQNTASISIGQAADLITEWLNAKSRIFAPPFDLQLVSQLTTGTLYNDTLKAIDFLRNNDAFYQYGVQKVESVERFAASGNKATIEVKVTEDTTLYKRGQILESSFNTKLVRYNLENWDGIWKIANSQVLN
ncbi:ARC6/PARC6 family protein [Planktothrix mougeotii]|uniref:ARC6/PARC6 family protein n=1 Tax=Planktothrix mougeotii LEGE 06226 TaxID=1828728 RepID=A0ABR9UJ87_9CYAN|nr:ARC6/PARC6 family protein [Planktothrix mougeotii]MBE9146179.1 ARC6/PARC6 family protein [Planktothrix mougeotii LEGE 06226]